MITVVGYIFYYTMIAFQTMGIFTFAFSLILFRTKPYKQEFVLFSVAGLTLIILSGILRVIMGWFLP